jgi:predicted unusual protein kinase regulating ubiquinone biosynthesis (AarF/ABC1/UbiB family)/nucleotide-binding universal stress UspA family protein
MVATDRSETAERAVQWAATFAERSQAELFVVQVVVAADFEAPGVAELAESARDDIVRHARALAGPRGRGRVIVAEDPAIAIVRASAEDAIDVLVVGNAGMTDRKEFLLGNVPNRISHNARCTVVIVNTLGADTPTAWSIPPEQRADSVAPASQIGRIARGRTIAAVFAKHGIRELLGSPDEEGATGRRRQAKRLRSALEELGPTFAKLGQLLSTRPDLLPQEFIEELSELQDAVPPLTEEEVVRVMEQDLGVPWEDAFETIEREPLAAGSIAQVHRATLASGDKVVVKVQRPEARQQITQDLALLKLFVEKLGTRPGVRRVVDVPHIFEHLSTSLQQELDFRREAKNAERLRGTFKDFPRLTVPAIHSEISTPRLLVMQDVGGVDCSEVPEALRKDVARQIVESFCAQILVEGFFHGDPHPGNALWQPAEERLYFIDLGLAGEVGPELREAMILMLIAFAQKDPAFLTDVLLTLSDSGRRVEDVDALTKEVEEFVAKHRGESVKTVAFGPVLQELMAISFRHGIALPPALSMTAKSLSQMHAITAKLDPNIDPFEVSGRFLLGWLLRRTIAQSDPKTLGYELQKLRLRALRVLESLERVVGARPGPRTALSFKATALEGTLRAASRRLALGIAAGFALLASALSATSARAGGWPALAFGALGGVLVLILLWDLTKRDADTETT